MASSSLLLSQSLFCCSPAPNSSLRRLQLSANHAVPPARTPLALPPLRNRLTPSGVGLASPLPLHPISKRSSPFVVRASALPAVSVHTLQWVSAVSTAVLMVTRGTTIQKSFLVPLFALQAPTSIVAWIKGEYGMWTAFLTLLIRLFYFIPGELDLPFLTMLFLITAPYQAMTLRGSQGGALISLAIAAYLAFQHFSRLGNLKKGFEQGSIIATLAIIVVTVVPLFFMF